MTCGVDLLRSATEGTSPVTWCLRATRCDSEPAYPPKAASSPTPPRSYQESGGASYISLRIYSSILPGVCPGPARWCFGRWFLSLVDRLQSALGHRYRIERELGRGGMATVYLAEDLKHQRRVALKVLRPELGAALGGERFLREIATCAALQHPHILGLLDSGEIPPEHGAGPGLLFYAMPYVEGESLRDLLNRKRQLPLDEAITIAREVADALGYAHTRDI